MNRDQLREQLPHTLQGTAFEGLGPRYEGKVRDVYDQGDKLVIVATDRVSAFDRVLGTIPFKGEILNRLALWAFEQSKDIAPNHVLSSPDPNVTIARKCTAFPVEFVVRAYITGSLWRDYLSGQASAYEVSLPTGLHRDEALRDPILTPATKAAKGEHDEPTSKRAILASGAMTEAQLEAAEATALALFARGQTVAQERGLILVDTKYEMGVDDQGTLRVIDEIHTPDSSRFWIEETYDARFAQGQAQQMLDKENLRGWLLEEHGFSGDGPAPALSDDIRLLLAERYLTAFERLTGEPFDAEPGPVLSRVLGRLEKLDP